MGVRVASAKSQSQKKVKLEKKRRLVVEAARTDGIAQGKILKFFWKI